ncbi:hypothetical protein QTJ16_005184 [Diplocarpon rosae]|uniref:Pali-domain-containing protein n=1 Tax=Diplocarpon rosae TaxID=946125 RepID=A0AAD9SYI5_9HELO|nr:hypothetical protein QTJ16_005184 [Diplocarpon rosae]
MANKGAVNHDGAFLLLAGAIMLMFAAISAPIINDIAMLEVKLTNGSYVKFGTFGHCITGTAPIIVGKDYCSGRELGYSPLSVMTEISGATYDEDDEEHVKRLTRAMILHPVGCGVAFLAFLFAIASAFFGSFIPTLLSAIAWLISLIVTACDFAAFEMVKKKIKVDGSGNKAHLAIGIWMVLTAMLIMFMATVVVLIAFFQGWRQQHDGAGAGEGGCKHTAGHVTTAAPPKRRFWQRSNLY